MNLIFLVVGETAVVWAVGHFLGSFLMAVLGGHETPLAVNMAGLFLTALYLVYAAWVYKRDSLGSIWRWRKPSAIATIGTLFVIGASLLGRGSRVKTILLPAIQMVFRPWESARLDMCVFAPLREEVMFRGLLLRRLVPLVGTWPAIAISSVAFGLVHPSPLGAMGQGVLLAWLYSPGGAGNLYAPMILHALINLSAEMPLPYR